MIGFIYPILEIWIMGVILAIHDIIIILGYDK